MPVILAALVVIFAASAIQGSVGFGANLLAMPIMVQLDPDLVPGPTLIATTLLNVLVIRAEWGHVQFRPIGQALLGRLAGTALAVVALGYLSQRSVGLIIAVVVLIAAAVSAAGFTAERTGRNMLVAGSVSGFSATTAGIGGPPVALLFVNDSGPRIRGSLALYFLIGMFMTLTGLAVAGRFGAAESTYALILVPASVLGFAVSRPLSRLVDRGFARPAILVLCSIAAIVLLARLALDA